MYRFLLSPKWILSHVLVGALLVSMLGAMFWQISRMHEREAVNAVIAERSEGETLDFSTIVDREDLTDPAVQGSLEYQAVRLVGTYDTEREFTIPNRTLDGAPGRLVVTPLVWSQTEAPILAIRGFIPQSFSDNEAPIDGAEPPSGTVQVAGYLRLTETPGSLQLANPDLGKNQVARMDLEQLQEVRGAKFQPMYLLVANQDPPTDQALLSTYPLPAKSEGRHLSYAVQWGIFTAIAAAGYPIVLRRIARNKAGKTLDEVPTELERGAGAAPLSP
ncbi:MAG: SURF1 family protein [Actinobacteria bacterium]|nr:SURF1 family protein [Actinomycetota bacterium]